MSRPVLKTTGIWRTAIHEAGHAVMALEEGRPFEEVRLQLTADSRGATTNLSYRPGDDEVVRMLLGGIVAVRLCRTRWYPALFDSAHDDIGHAADFFREDNSDVQMIEWNVSATAQRVERRWAAVEAVAVELVRHRRLSHDRIRGLATKRLAGRRPPSTAGSIDWRPLIEHVGWRIRYPRGLEDACEALEVEIEALRGKA